ncbi:hypothetical protein D3C75_1283810 [compost metagenome]
MIPVQLDPMEVGSIEVPRAVQIVIKKGKSNVKKIAVHPLDGLILLKKRSRKHEKEQGVCSKDEDSDIAFERDI